MEWETVIGLEVHTQLATNTKIFSRAATAYGAEPNTQACAIDLGLPGVLPVLNEAAVDMAIKLGLAIEAKINMKSVFSRKHYFYPDLPKGYQISQYDLPIVGPGHLDLVFEDGHTKRINIERAHLEEDAGKSLHEDFDGQSGIDLNRAGTPLLEIVSCPDMRSAEEAVLYLKTLHTLVRYLGISDGNMQEGSFRCDVNISVMPKGSDTLGTRTELKNINSFRFVERAIQYESARQIHVLTNGGSINQETRTYDPVKNETRSLRSKEDAHDYRYFPDPDLRPLVLSEAHIETLRATLPELPHAKRVRFQGEFSLSAYDASVLVANAALAEYFETVAQTIKAPKLAANWVMGELSAWLNKENMSIQNAPVQALQLANLLKKVQDNTISVRSAKTVFEYMWTTQQTAEAIIEEHNLAQMQDTGALEALVQQVIDQNPAQHVAYQGGKDKLFGFFVGQVMKASGGKAPPAEVNRLLKKLL